MSPTALAGDPVEDFLRALATELGDLPATARAELLDDVREHLLEVQAETGDLAQTVGTPARYAAELRAATGLPEVAARAVAVRQPSLLARARAHPASRWLLAFLRELQPGWWVVRGALAGSLLWLARGDRTSYDILHLHGLLLPTALLGVVASVVLGLLTRHGPVLWRAVGTVVSVGVAVAALTVAADLQLRLSQRLSQYGQPYPAPSAPPSSLTEPDGLVYNIYPYDRDGHPLSGVQLFDQSGRPLQVRVGQDPAGAPLARTVPVGPDGRPLDNVFPQTQQTTGSGYGDPGALRASAAPATVAPVPTASLAVVLPGAEPAAPVLIPGAVPSSPPATPSAGARP